MPKLRQCEADRLSRRADGLGKLLVRDPQNLHEFQRSGAPDLMTFIVSDMLAGSINHLWLGLLVGVGLGALGGMLGKALASGSNHG